MPKKDADLTEKQRKWLEENAEAFKTQSEWHEKHGHPLADILVGPCRDSWVK